MGRYTIDTHHSPSYAVGYIFNKVQPRMAMTTHMPYDPYVNAETIAEVREHWKAPNADTSIAKYGGLIIPTPSYQREDLQSQFIRYAEIDPDLYYPEGYRPVLMEHWPTDKPIFIPEELGT